MTSQVSAFLGFLAMLASACGGPLKTGTISRPDASAKESLCPNDTTQCGTGPSAVCLDLRNDPEHCGSCQKACEPGVACAAGVCQRVLCQGQPVLSEAPITSTPILDLTFGGAALADVNGDGRLDLVHLHNPMDEIDPPIIDSRKIGPGNFSVLFGQGGGRFGPAQTYTTPGRLRGVQVADINHDGADDLFFLEMGSPCRELWLGHADGSLTASPTFPVVECDWAMAIADLSGDGYLDVAVGTSDYYNSKLHVYLSDGAGILQYSGAYAVPDPSQLLVRDWNGDGLPDLVSLGISTLNLLTNRGAGIFDEAVDCGLALGYQTVVSDFDRDGHMDLATTHSYGVEVLRGLGGCRFTSAAGFDTGLCNTLQPADMDGDRLLDLVCVSNDQFTGLMANPDGSLQATAPIRLVGAAGSDAVLVGDVTGDGRPDVVTADRHGPVRVWENTCP